MNKKLKRIYILILILMSGYVAGQQNKPNKLGEIKTTDGKLIEMYSKLVRDFDTWSFKDEQGKSVKVLSKNIEWVKMGSQRYFWHARKHYKNDKKDMALLELVVQNDKYKLFTLGIGASGYVYIFDMNDELTERLDMVFVSGYPGYAHKDNIKAIERIATYFPKCDFINKINENLSNRKYLFTGVGYTACAGAPDIEPLFK